MPEPDRYARFAKTWPTAAGGMIPQATGRPPGSAPTRRGDTIDIVGLDDPMLSGVLSGKEQR